MSAFAGAEIEVTSRANPWVRRFRQAIDQHQQDILVEGPKSVRDAIAAGWYPIAIALGPGVEFAAEGTRRIRLSENLLRTLSDTVHSQGVLALFERPTDDPAGLFADASTITIALDGVQDPGNVGTIMRLATAFEVGGVAVLEGSADPLGPKAIRASAGMIFHTRMARLDHHQLLERANQHGLTIYAASARGEPLDPPEAGALLVFGSEGRGISDPLARVARHISIRTSPSVDSLNVAAAAAILLARSFERRRTPAQPARTTFLR